MLNQNEKNSSSLSAWTAVVALTGLGASLAAAGSTGFLAYPLRTILTWILLGVAILLAWPHLQARPLAVGRRYKKENPYTIKIPVVLISLFVIVIFNFILDIPFNEFSVPIVLAGLALELKNKERTAILSAAAAAAILAVFRTAVSAVPFLWGLTDGFAGMLGNIAGFFAGKSFRPGSTFAAVDCIVLMTAWYVLWLLHTRPNRKKYALYGALIITAGHFVYLISAAFTAGNLKWYFPALACLVHLIIAALMYRWPPMEQKENRQKEEKYKYKKITIGAAVLLTAVFVLITSLHPGGMKLTGKKIVIYEKGFINWLKPVHGDYGRLSQGMYGMLPEFIKSFGADCVVSPHLSGEDLKDADGLVLIYPDQPWEDGQLERIWRFVREGGSLLVMGEHTVREKDGGSRINDVLEPTEIKVNFDSATYAVGGWLHSYARLSHPMTIGIDDDQNQFGVVIGASLEIRCPARPVIVGRWGWADYGDPAGESMMGNNAYDPGEKIGDIVLAAEQSLGKGRVIVFGDTSGITNGIVVSCHEFAARLLGYLVNKTGTGNFPVYLRGVIGFLLSAAVILVFFFFRKNEAIIILCVVLIVLLQGVCISISRQAAKIVPAGLKTTGKKLAYIDSSHLNAFSSESWREDGTMGLALTLMRNGYLTLMLPEFDGQRLQEADLFISIAPLKQFSGAERKTVKKFIQKGGIFICICGFEERKGCASLLADFHLSIGIPEDQLPGNTKGGRYLPLPMGYFKSPYMDRGDYMLYVRFHAAWPVFSGRPGAEVVAYGHGNLPVILFRGSGKGKIALIGDTGFAMNKNLEHEEGYPFEGLRENAHFWRWFLTYLNEETAWIPPRPVIEEGEAVEEVPEQYEDSGVPQ